MTGFEGSCRRAYFKSGKHGGIDLQKAPAVKEGTDFPENKRLPDFGIDDQVKISLPVSDVGIGKAVLFFGQGAQTLGKHFDMRAVDRHFSRLRLEHVSLHAYYIAQIVIFFEGSVILFSHVVAADVKLDKPVAVGDMRKRSLAHNAAGHKSAGKPYGFTFVIFEAVFDGGRICRSVKAYFHERIFTFVGQFL